MIDTALLYRKEHGQKFKLKVLAEAVLKWVPVQASRRVCRTVGYCSARVSGGRSKPRTRGVTIPPRTPWQRWTWPGTSSEQGRSRWRAAFRKQRRPGPGPLQTLKPAACCSLWQVVELHLEELWGWSLEESPSYTPEPTPSYRWAEIFTALWVVDICSVLFGFMYIVLFHNTSSHGTLQKVKYISNDS